MSTELHTVENSWGLEPLLDVTELAAYLGVPVSTVYEWRTRGTGPRAYRFGKHLKFAVSDVRIWVEAAARRLVSREAVTPWDANA
ncbi:helix-turn-helix transcriptional regulator [Demequina sp.]|uniref:helix-turn-helix transcriptional regulator n=1 Tax=Demequina sp. TaxID=2050685 RepID=UPI003A89AF6C